MTRRTIRGCRPARSIGKARSTCRSMRGRWAPAIWNSPATTTRCHCASAARQVRDNAVMGGIATMLDNLAPIDEAGRLSLAIAMAVFMGLAFEGVYKRE